jgi:hypothetical protein
VRHQLELSLILCRMVTSNSTPDHLRDLGTDSSAEVFWRSNCNSFHKGTIT